MSFIWAAFLIGLLGSLHCIGMCGPIALALPIGKWNPLKRLSGNLLYQFGRISTYALLGALIGLLGDGLRLAGTQQYLSIVAGVMMLFMAFLPGFDKKLEAWTSETSFMQRIRKGIQNAFQKKSLMALFGIGILNGFLPCGLVYAALFGSLAMESVSQSIYFMIFFGLGTVPAMAFIAMAGNYIGARLRKQLRRFVPIFVGMLGLLFILRGLGLGIPYLSPPEKALIIQQDSEPESCH